MKDELVDIMMNIHHFNQDLTNLNIKYSEEIEKQKEEIERLNNIIKEVREYIEERYNGEVLTHTFDKDNVGELLNILKGVDKEWAKIKQ